MRDRKSRGSVMVEFAWMMFLMVPMLVLTYAIGFNLLMELEVVQLTRDAGHMFVTLHEVSRVSLSDPVFLSILAKVGGSAGYPVNAQVIFSRIVYVDDAECALGGGPPCANLNQWVYTQYYVTPAATPSTIAGFTPTFNAPKGPTPNDTQGDYNLSDSVSNSGMVVNNFSSLGIVPYALNPTLGLPSGQGVYFVEAGAAAFNLPGVVSITALRDSAVF